MKRINIEEDRFCIGCGKILVLRWKKKFCSNQCQSDLKYRLFLNEWLSGQKKVSTKNISGFIKRYFLVKYQKKCSKCSWSEMNPVTNKVPLEVDHIDGNPENNIESNLRLLCPNCHSLTPFFRNLNKGNGRKWRRETSYYPGSSSLKNTLI